MTAAPFQTGMALLFAKRIIWTVSELHIERQFLFCFFSFFLKNPLFAGVFGFWYFRAYTIFTPIGITVIFRAACFSKQKELEIKHKKCYNTRSNQKVEEKDDEKSVCISEKCRGLLFGNTQVFYMKNAVATISSFGSAPVVIAF